MVLCQHGRVYPCPSCNWIRRAKLVLHGLGHVTLFILACALGAGLYLLASEACATGYCGTCDASYRCPGSCACDTSTRHCVSVD